MCRECIRGEEWEERIRLQRVRNHFIFSVESVGQYKARDIVVEALKVLKGKARKMMADLKKTFKKK